MIETKETTMTKFQEIIRYGSFGPIVWADGDTRLATQEDLDTLPVGPDLTTDEESEIEDD